MIARARKTELGGVRDNALVVRLAAPPLEGAANEARVDYFAALLRLPRRAVRIVSGERGRRKRIALAGVTADELRQLVKASRGKPR